MTPSHVLQKEDLSAVSLASTSLELVFDYGLVPNLQLLPPNPRISSKQELTKKGSSNDTFRKDSLFIDAVIDLQIKVSCYEKALSISYISNILKAPKRKLFENTIGNICYRSRGFQKEKKP